MAVELTGNMSIIESSEMLMRFGSDSCGVCGVCVCSDFGSHL